jgi:hypothetical protein
VDGIVDAQPLLICVARMAGAADFDVAGGEVVVAVVDFPDLAECAMLVSVSRWGKLEGGNVQAADGVDYVDGPCSC